jgi:hypothetical protein
LHTKWAAEGTAQQRVLKIAYIWNESSSLRRKPIIQGLSDFSKEMGGCKRACILLAAAFIQLPQG